MLKKIGSMMIVGVLFGAGGCVRVDKTFFATAKQQMQDGYTWRDLKKCEAHTTRVPAISFNIFGSGDLICHRLENGQATDDPVIKQMEATGKSPSSALPAAEADAATLHWKFATAKTPYWSSKRPVEARADHA